MATVQSRFWAKVDTTGPCWLWTATTRKGYGLFTVNGANTVAHRWAYEFLVGPIPEGKILDHLCRNRACVRPAHLEVVDQRTNILRGKAPTAVNAAKTHCIHGHEFTPENTYRRPNRPQNRNCRTCMRLAEEARRKRAAS